jgi:DNA-binding transcriptional regulator YbjK
MAARVADAALEVLGTGGMHALSHSRVDATAGVPAGSTSNYFRTRATLVAAALDRLHDLDEQDWQAAQAAGRPATRAELITAYAAFVDAATGPLRTRTAARYVLYSQGVVEPALLGTLNENRARVVRFTARTLAELGAPAPDEAATTLLAAVEGLILHRLSGFSDAPVRAHLTGLVAALLPAAKAEPHGDGAG